MTTRSDSATPPAVVRFDAVERAVHWVQALLVLSLLGTGMVLYFGPLAALIGRRPTVRMVHVWSGLLLPVPFVAGAAGRWGAALRRDLAALNRFSPTDWQWLRARGRHGDLGVGKFNAGQKLNASFLAGAAVVMLATGSIMHWFAPFPDDWRTGATFVHDWLALAIGVAVAGHIWLGVTDADALGGMWRGTVPAEWARRKRPLWWQTVAPPPTDTTSPD